MNTLQRGVFAIFAAAFIRSVLLQILQDRNLREWIHLLGGIYITVVIVGGIRQLDYNKLMEQLDITYTGASEYALEGKNQARSAMEQIIKQNCEAYILDVAEQMDVTVTVDVFFSDEEVPVPEKIMVYGSVSPYAKTKLSAIITEDLGLDRGSQVWIG